MRAKHIFRLSGFVVLAVLPTALSKACTRNQDCDPKCCVVDTDMCSENNKESVLGGTVVEDRCECKTFGADPATKECSCINAADCKPGFECCTPLTHDCKEKNAVFGGDPAEVDCQCKSGKVGTTGECTCTDDAHCKATECCDTLTKKCEVKNLLGGAAAVADCQCLSEKIDDGKCTCNDDSQCPVSECCHPTLNFCAKPPQAKASVSQGQSASHKCECISDSLNADRVCECVDAIPECADDEICCPEEKMCVTPGIIDPTACGDPHMTGFHGQKFDFTGEDGGWYSLVSDPLSMHLNMRVTAPIPSLPVITYITGLSLLTKDDDGVDHTIVITVKDPHSLESVCPENVQPCLADGSLNVVIDGDEVLIAPGTVKFGPGMQVTAVNIPGECRSFGYETYWERKKLEYAQSGRRLLAEALSIGEWILADPTATNMVECATYVARAMSEEGAIFAHQSEHASFQIVTPTGTIRLSHGRLHQLPTRDPTDQFDLPDHLTWQMNMAIDHTNISQDAKGILGETFVPTRDENGNIIMHGMECIRGEESDYAVAGPLGVTFAQGDHSS